MNLNILKIKLRLEIAIMSPFILLGKLYAISYPLQTKHKIFLLLPNADIGGSIQVNLDLATCLIDKNPLIIFSKKAKNNKFKNKYNSLNLTIFDLHKIIDNKIYHFMNFVYRGIIAEWAKQQNIEAVIGGENIFFYKVIPHLNKNIKRIEILHVDTWNKYTIGFIDQISTRVFSTQKLKDSIEKQYKKHNISKSYFSKLKFIENGLTIVENKIIKNDILQVYFIGRGAEQKRVHLVAAIAEKTNQYNKPIQFNFVGDVDKIINTTLFPYCNFYGSIYDESAMEEIYQKSDVLILTSSYEGLPVVVMQMMAHGKVVISTDVNSIPDYIIHNQNGLLINATNELDIVNQGVDHILKLYENPELRKTFGEKSKQIAIEKFNMELFCKNYNYLVTN
jgi:glycosyltransferase involved in cell wall biosynthesis